MRPAKIIIMRREKKHIRHNAVITSEPVFYLNTPGK